MPSVCVGEQNGIDCGERMTVPVDGGKMEKEWETGTSIIEQLVPEIRMHALTFLDYPSLCGLSMTNSLLHRAANDESVWKALYLKDFSLEQGNVKPANGWKAYYAATVAIVKCNAEFYRIVKERSHSAISQFWHNAGYVKCFHANGKSFTGYNEVMESWRVAFSWENVIDFQIRDVRTRVLTDMAWVTMKAFADMERAYNVTNIYELCNGIRRRPDKDFQGNGGFDHGKFMFWVVGL
ncbi:F-box protein SKIP8-like isoform X2 [Salvia miltiorrhiza]|uniref:F-box protein SKIP8-like isoform X2 n=1 Tax=Salvia miltiorrhiza TaxID=226208 RepID=UPI0025ABB63F|nr:F-box protein SKIP8-like isoform X2 [Salvia miltiorrhiza]